MQWYPEMYWYEKLLDEDSSRPLTSVQKSIIIKSSMKEAELQKMCIEKTYGNLPATDILQQLGFYVEEENETIMPYFLYLGLLEPDTKRVRLNHGTVSMIEVYLETYFPEKVVQRERLREIVLYHELYHAIEECTEEIYTRKVRVRKCFLGLIPYDKVVEAASEIGAIHFSKIMSGVNFSPYIYTQYLLEAAKQNLEV